jgi:hypothetical protein
MTELGGGIINIQSQLSEINRSQRDLDIQIMILTDELNDLVVEEK